MLKPKKIWVDGEEVPIVYNQKLGQFAEGYGYGGDYRKGKGIRVAGGLTRRGERVTILHELCHHLWHRADLERFLPKTTEELVLESLCGWLFKTLYDNPELVEYLFLEEEI